MSSSAHGPDPETLERRVAEGAVSRRVSRPALGIAHEGSIEDVVLDAAEARVVAQLVEALLFEHLVVSRRSSLGPSDARTYGSVYDSTVYFDLGAATFRCVATISSFDRARVAHGSVERLGANDAHIARLHDLVESLDVSATTRARLGGELEQTLALCRWNAAHLSSTREPRRHLDFQRLESAIVEGHPYHPCFKARTGFTLEDHRDFGPESGRAFQLEWLAVPRAYARTALPADEAAFLEQELGLEACASLLERLAICGGDLTSHVIIPVHPWQLRSLRARGLHERGRAAEIIALGRAGDQYRATQSVRTLVNVSDPKKANVKVPLDIVCTSSHRNLVANFVCTAPPISAWIASMMEGDPFLRARGHVAMLREYAAAIFEGDDPALEGRIGVLFRESVCAKLVQGEHAIPFNALALVEPDGRTFIADWIDRYDVAAWVDRLLEVVLVPIWHMLVHHGVAFESHAQNLILVHRDGWPERVVLRDFHDTTEFVQDYLRDPTSLPDFASIDPHFATVADDDGYRMGSTEALRELFMDTVYVFNLADLAFVLARYHGFAEADFFRAARVHLDAYARSGITEASRIDRVGCDQPEILVESLLKKKLLDGGVLDFYEHRVRNSLHG